MSSARRNGSSSESPESSWTTTLAKALKSRSDWPDKDEILDVLYWGRQILALIIGVSFGIVPLYGIFAIGAYVAISTGIGQQFVVGYQKIDDEELGGFWEIAKEGFGAAFATFMVSWITTYSSCHF